MHVETSCFVFVKIFQEINIFLVLDSLMLVHFSLKTFLVFPGFFMDISFLVIESDLLFVESYL